MAVNGLWETPKQFYSSSEYCKLEINKINQIGTMFLTSKLTRRRLMELHWLWKVEIVMYRSEHKNLVEVCEKRMIGQCELGSCTWLDDSLDHGSLQETMKLMSFSPNLGNDVTTNWHPHRSTKLQVDGCKRIWGHGYNNRPVPLIKRHFWELGIPEIGVVWNKYTTS